jgi:ribose-phosphate pyrophosphokinase
MVFVSPDAGGVERTRAYAKRLKAGLAIVDKRRDIPNQAQAMHLIGDVKGKIAIVLDDMIDTAGTLCAAGEALFNNGAKEVMACATHAVFSGPAIDRINASHFSQVIVSDTIPQGDKPDRCPKLTCLSMAGLLARSIHNIHTGSSVSVLFV